MTLERPSRIESIDILRGIIMIIMALDHVRDFFSVATFDATDMSQTNPALFFTRWITHFCAPNFVFLSGISISLYAQKSLSRKQVSIFLFTRGLWLVVIEIVVISFLLVWSYQIIFLQVIWAIGFSMILLAGLIWLPRPVLFVLAFAMITLHQLIPDAPTITAQNLLGGLIHHTSFFFQATPSIFVAYTIVPWVGVMLAGYLIGPWFRKPVDAQKKYLRYSGIGLLIVFVILRLINLYGDPARWSVQERGPVFTFLSFLNVSKYPPSLLFLCLTIGTGLLVLSFMTTVKTKAVLAFFRMYGSVPFFYYVLHLLFIALGCYVWTLVMFGKSFNVPFSDAASRPADYSPSLLRTYVFWIILIAILYFPCRWFSNYRKTHRQWWLSYF
jgi:uncharacterized membrane protein